MSKLQMSAAKNPRVTVKMLRELAKSLGMTVRLRDGEYRVAFNEPNNEAAAAYTNDAEDAFGTMKDMAKWRGRVLTVNPRVKFGKRKAKHDAFKHKRPAKRATFGKKKKPALKLGSRIRLVGFRKNPARDLSNVERWAVVAKDHKGTVHYYTGYGFSPDKKSAAMYSSAKHARFVTDRMPNAQLPRGFQNFYIWHGSIVELMK